MMVIGGNGVCYAVLWGTRKHCLPSILAVMSLTTAKASIGAMATYENNVYIGLITCTHSTTGLPFISTNDTIEPTS